MNTDERDTTTDETVVAGSDRDDDLIHRIPVFLGWPDRNRLDVIQAMMADAMASTPSFGDTTKGLIETVYLVTVTSAAFLNNNLDKVNKYGFPSGQSEVFIR